MTRVRLPKSEITARLIERDGLVCTYPGCDEQLDLEATGKLEVTIDHWFPIYWAKANDWTDAQIWDLSNLRLMTKKCNAKKGSLIPNEDGTLPEKVRKQFRYRRDKRATRPEVCQPCQSGRNLGPNEVCASCNSGPMPERYPRWAKVKPNECDHEMFWCWCCASGIAERVPAVDAAVRQGESGEWDV